MNYFCRHMRSKRADSINVRVKRGDSDTIVAEYMAWLNMNKLKKTRNCQVTGCGLIRVLGNS